MECGPSLLFLLCYSLPFFPLFLLLSRFRLFLSSSSPVLSLASSFFSPNCPPANLLSSHLLSSLQGFDRACEQDERHANGQDRAGLPSSHHPL